MTRPAQPPAHGKPVSVWRRALRSVGRATVTVVILAGAGFAVHYGASHLAQRADARPAPDAAPILPVSAMPIVQEDGFRMTRAFIGQVEPARTVALSFELPGRLAEISADEGDFVRAGQVLATQDTALLQADRQRLEAARAATKAQLGFAIQTADRNQTLMDRGFTSQSGLDEAVARQDELRARIAEIDASLANVDIRVEKSRLLAPFDGRITARQVDGGETLGAGQTVLGLVALDRPQVRIGVPLDVTETALDAAVVAVDGQHLPARLITLRPDIDPVTRTRTALLEIDSEEPLAFGQTARLILTERVDVTGYWMPVTSLKEGVRGQWTVLVVDGSGIVRSASVEILHAESQRVYVRAAFPEDALLIDQGPQRVTIGQQVSVDNAV